MLEGISGAGAPGDPGGVDGDPKLKLPQAPRESVNAETTPKLAIVRALRDLTIISPKLNPWSRPSRNQAQIRVGSNDRRVTPALQSGFPWSIVYQRAFYISLITGLTPLLDRIGATPYSPERTISTPRARLPKDTNHPAPWGRR